MATDKKTQAPSDATEPKEKPADPTGGPEAQKLRDKRQQQEPAEGGSVRPSLNRKD